jgi:predicted DNA-binding protein (UPF0278 family)
MIDLDLVKILRVAADEYEKVILRNRKLDDEINQLRRKYNQDITEIRSNPSPKIHTATVIVNADKLKQVVIASEPGISKRALTALAKLKVVKAEDFKKLTLARIRAVKGCGVSTQFEIEDLALKFGYDLK